MDPDWKILPSLSALRAFDMAARHLSFARAAAHLNVTPSAVAQQVRGLEQDLGVPLTRRSGRGIDLTGEGQRLAASLERGFGEIADGIAGLRDHGARRGVRVNTRPNIMSEFLISRIAAFWEAHPEIEVSLVPSAWRPEVFDQGFDLAICIGDGCFPELRATALVRSRRVVLTAPQNVPADPVDLRKLRWVINPDLAEQTAFLERLGVDLSGEQNARIISAAHVLPAVREGLGAVLSNAFVVRRDIVEGRLVAIEVGDLPAVGYWAVTRPGPLRPPVQTFIDWLRHVFAEEARKFPDHAWIEPEGT